MNQRPARVAAIHDLAGFGRCSLSTILPTLSTMGVQVCPVPTAILSSHTGGLGEVEFRDLTSYIPSSLEHYKRLNLDFECVYSGFLGSEEQIDHCLDYFSAYPNALAAVDPVMGDHGKAYRTYTEEMCNRLGELVHVADVITPNLTEACMLLKIPYISDGLTRVQARSLLAKLGELGPNYVVITGVQLATGEMANIGYDKANNSYWVVCCDYVPVSYPGTGDIFASVLIGAFLTGDSLPIAMGRATYFVERCIKTTFSYSSDTRYGVMLEKELSVLTNNANRKDFSIL